MSQVAIFRRLFESIEQRKEFIRPFLFYYYYYYYYYYYSINLEKKERKTESKISGPSFVGENYDPQSLVHSKLNICKYASDE